MPISNRKAKLSLIHIAKKDMGLTDDAYRVLLDGAAGVNSAANLEYEYQFNAVMKAFEKLGFNNNQKRVRKNPRPQWDDEWGGTPDQRAKIEVMWKTRARKPTDKALRSFIKRIAKVDHPRFLRVELAQKVIIALEAMIKKTGLDPATGRRIEQ
ncbi:MAG: regulatory protein GemA [Treponema sp.]|jgi:hypothetical protein|nr:regulatory protein GemA [Treponema sp.]